MIGFGGWAIALPMRQRTGADGEKSTRKGLDDGSRPIARRKGSDDQCGWREKLRVSVIVNCVNLSSCMQQAAWEPIWIYSCWTFC